MFTPVLSKKVTATGTVLATQRARVKSLYIVPGGLAGSVVLRDGGAGGSIRIDVDTTANGQAFNHPIPGNGTLFETDVHATLTNVTSVTVFYG